MMWTTTGNLTNVRTNAKFPFGVAMLPAGKRRGSPTGGGNFYISSKAPQAPTGGGLQVRQVDDLAPSAPRSGRVDTGYVAVAQGQLRHRRAEEVRGRLPGGPRSRATSSRTPWPNSRRTRTSA